MWRWINPDRFRYYQVHLVQDLLGDWTLIQVWGALHSRRGGMRMSAVVSYEAGLERIARIGKRRRQRGYYALTTRSSGETR